MRPFTGNKGSRTGLHSERQVTPSPVPNPRCVPTALEPGNTLSRRLEASVEIQNYLREKTLRC